MIDAIIKKIEETEVTITSWVLGFVGILFVRFILEALSSPTRSGVIASNAITLVHYGLFWTTLTLGLILVFGYFTKNYSLSTKMALFSMPVIWIAPIVDVVLSGGKGYIQSYILDSGKSLFIDFLTFFGPEFSWGATYGIRLEILIVLLGFGWYLHRLKKGYAQIAFGILSVYIVGFVVASWPGILYTLRHLDNTVSTLPDVFKYYGDIISRSNITFNMFHEGPQSVSLSRFVELGFDTLSSQILFLTSTILSLLLFYKISKNKFFAVIKNMRFERIGSYLALLFAGAGFAYINGFGRAFIWTDVFGFLCITIAWTSLWMYAVHNNDVEDVDIDKISNTTRPLVNKVLSTQEMRDTGNGWLVISLIGAFCAGFYPFFMALVYIFASYIYSTPPLRLRRFPVLPSFIIGVASLATILAGFFFVSINKNLHTFPIPLALGIIVMVTLAINVKDMKDIEGDKANGILTLPVLFGNNGSKIVGVCFALSFLLLPLFLSFYLLYIFSIPCAIIGYKLVTKKPFSEKPLFILRFSFLFLVGLSFLSLYLISLHTTL